MINHAEQYIRWEPLADLPEYPFDVVDIKYENNRLSLLASYAFDPKARKLLIEFGDVEAFKAYEELSDPWMQERPEQPLVQNDLINAWVWPLQEVKSSRWIDRVTNRNGAIEGFALRHFCIVTADKSLHVMTVRLPEKVELIP